MSVEPEALSVREELEARLRRMERRLEATNEKLARLTTERDNLRRAYRQLMEQFELLRRRIFIAKAERVDSTQLELEFEQTKQQLDALAQKLEEGSASTTDADGETASDNGELGSRPSGNPGATAKSPTKGSRNLGEADHLVQRRIEIRDAELEKSGAVQIGWEESYKLGYQRPEPVRVTIARAKYKVPVADESSQTLPEDATVVEQDGDRFTIITAPLPALLIRRGVLAPSMLARIIVQKFRFGMPFFRQEEQFEADAIEIHRATMARSVEEVGACLGTIVQACSEDARKHAFCRHRLGRRFAPPRATRCGHLRARRPHVRRQRQQRRHLLGRAAGFEALGGEASKLPSILALRSQEAMVPKENPNRAVEALAEAHGRDVRKARRRVRRNGPTTDAARVLLEARC